MDEDWLEGIWHDLAPPLFWLMIIALVVLLGWMLEPEFVDWALMIHHPVTHDWKQMESLPPQ